MPIGKQSLKFNESGRLTAGIHDCTLEQLQMLTFTNSHRRNLGRQLIDFLAWAVELRGFSYSYIGGGFVSSRPDPQDIDLILETRVPFGPQSFVAIEPFFRMGLEEILKKYSVHLHFWMEGAPSSIRDYRSFFQYSRPQRLGEWDCRQNGIARLSLGSCELTEAAQLENVSRWGQPPSTFDETDKLPMIAIQRSVIEYE